MRLLLSGFKELYNDMTISDQNIKDKGYTGNIVKKENALLSEYYYHLRHKSGLEIFLFPKDMTVSYATLGVKFGSGDCEYFDSDGVRHILPDGTAHFMEHKMFENIDGSDSFEKFSALGADSNAYTTYDRTVYLFNCNENFSACLTELLTFVTAPCFRDGSVERERGIISQEILMYADNPYNRCYELLLEAMYEKNPVRTAVCGSVESIKKITPELMYKCWNDYYCASNMVLVVCGNVELNDVMAVADMVLEGDNHAVGREAATTCVDLYLESEFVSTPRVRTEMPVARPLLGVGYKITDRETNAHKRQRTEIALSILNELLFSHSGELYNSLYSDGLISSWFSSSFAYTKQFANLIVSTETSDPDTVMERIIKYVELIKKNGIDADDFERCRRVIYSEFIGSFDSTEEISELLLDSAINGVDAFDYISQTYSVTLESVYEVLKKFLCTEYMSTVVVEPLPDKARASHKIRRSDK